MSITWSQAFAWRMQRHLLEPVGSGSVADVVRRLGAVLATRRTLGRDRRRGAARTLADRRTRAGHGQRAGHQGFAFRGAMHYLSPEDGGAYLALRSAGRQWELPSWQKHYELKATDWSGFRETVREALEEGPLTIADLGTAVTRKQAYRHLRPVFDDGAGTLIKPLTWQGDMSLEASRNGKHTFQRLADNPRWAGMKGQLVAVDVEGETAYVVSEDVDPLMAARPTGAVRFLPGHDQWVIGSGTKDEHVVPAAHRAPVTRKANLVVASGVVSGTWLVKGGEVEVTWFEGNGAPPRKALEQQVDKLATLTGRPLRSTLQVV